MPRKPSPPSLKLHRGSNQAYVLLDGVRHYCGIYGTDAAQKQFARIMADFYAKGSATPAPAEERLVVELLDRFNVHAKSYYMDRNTGHISMIHVIIRDMNFLYGSLPVASFGPLHLEALRQEWQEPNRLLELEEYQKKTGMRTRSRKTLNKMVRFVQLIFKWGTSKELVPAMVHHALTTVSPLKAGRTTAPETGKVQPVWDAHIDKVKALLPRPLVALVDLQLLSGARPGELLRLRPCDLDTTGEIWMATLAEHKTQHHGKVRTLFFGPKAIAILRGFIADRPIDAYMFSPREAVRERIDGRDEKDKKNKPRRANQKPNRKKTTRTVADHYSTASYNRAILRACVKAGIPPWTPGQLRHNAATQIRREFGLEMVQAVLGHSQMNTSEIYAEQNQERAMELSPINI